MRHRPCLSVVLASASLALVTAVDAHAAIYRVGSDAACTHATIQAAVSAASANPGSDEVRLRNQAYTDQAIVVSFANDPSNALTLIGGYASCADAQPVAGQRTVIDGGSSQPVLTINFTRTTALTNLDIRDGTSQQPGGGIRFLGTDGGILVLSNTVVRGNRAPSGGGIYVENLNSTQPVTDAQVLLFGNSSVISNSATVSGGGIDCRHATVQLFDQSHVSFNVATTGSGGGIHGQNCQVRSGSRGINGAVLWANEAPLGSGGGLHVAGALSTALIFPTDAAIPPRITSNSARVGGAIAVGAAAQASLFDSIIEDNTAQEGGAGVYVWSDSTVTGDSRFLMQGTLLGAPPEAVSCADAEACNLIRRNNAFNTGTSQPMEGAAVLIDAAVADSVHALFRGTRLEGNSGRSLTRHATAHGQVSLDGTVIAGNEVLGWLLDAPGATNSLVLSASTVAGNSIIAGGVIRGSGSCNIDNGYIGTHVYRSIVWQPGELLVTPSGAIQPDCFRYIMGNDFTGMPASAEREVANPQFVDETTGDYHLSLYSWAMDFAPAQPANSTRDRGARVVDLPQGNLLGPQDLGAYEEPHADRIFRHGFDSLENQ